MALPELLLPSTLPDFRAAGHKATPEPLYGNVERQGGTGRRRRLYTSTPRRLQAQLEVTQAQLETFVDWHENTLKAGSEPFTAKVAKIGAGVEYWEAHCLSFTVEHQEGSTHLISLELRLKGTPSDTAPTLSSLTAEVAAALSVQISGGYAYALSADFRAELDCQANTGAALFSEFLGRLDVVCSGALANPSLLADFTAGLQTAVAAGSSAALDAEVQAGLNLVCLDVLWLTAEATAALACSVEAAASLGYRNPATITLVAEGASFKRHTEAILRLLPDGSVYTKLHTAAYVLADNFYEPITTGVASGKWVRAVFVSGSGTHLYPATGVSRQFNASDEVLWTLSGYWQEPGVTQQVTFTVQIASDPDFASILSTFTADLTASWGGI